MLRVTHRLLVAIVGVVAVATVAMALWLRLGVSVPEPLAAVGPAPEERVATIIEVTTRTAEGTEAGFLAPGAVEADVRVAFRDTGETATISVVDETGTMFQVGQTVRVAVISPPGEPPLYALVDFERSAPLLLLAGLFVAAVVGFGRWQGARSLLGLGLTAVVVVVFLVPAVLAGRDPVLVAVTAGLAIMLLTLYLSHGAGPKTTAAALGTTLALALTALLAATFLEIANITGLTSEETQFVRFQFDRPLSLRGLLLAGIILGGLGVLDDVTVAQSSTVFELKRANPSAGLRTLIRGATAVGRDHVAATVNTLFLAYAGASLPLVLLFSAGPDSLGTVVTSELVATEVIRTLVGSIGLIAAVPFTTTLSAALAVGEPGVLRGADPPVDLGAAAADAAATDAAARPAAVPADPLPGAPAAADRAEAPHDDTPHDDISRDDTPHDDISRGHAAHDEASGDGISRDHAAHDEARRDLPDDAWERRLRIAYGLERDDDPPD